MTEPSAPGRRRRATRQRRPLLVNGEALRQTVEAPPRGGGEKFKPYSIEESRDRLVPQIQALRAQLSELPRNLRGDELVVQARLLPNFLAASSFPAALFDAAGLVPLGTRADRADLIERNGSVKADQPTKTVYLAVRDELATLANVLEGRTGRLTKQALEGLQTLDLFQTAQPFIQVGGDQDFQDRDEQGRITYETVLHGHVVDGRPAPASRAARERWESLVNDLGGELDRAWIRTSGVVTFVPILLDPDRALEASRFNQLRAVQPMPRLRDLPRAPSQRALVRFCHSAE